MADDLDRVGRVARSARGLHRAGTIHSAIDLVFGTMLQATRFAARLLKMEGFLRARGGRGAITLEFKHGRDHSADALRRANAVARRMTG